MTKVSAIISAYFGAEFLEGRIKNLQEQDPLPEIVVVCQFGSPEIEIAKKHKVVLVPTDDIPTIYKAWNLGIEACHGEYITNANCDDRFSKNGLKELVVALDEHPDYAVAYGNQEIVNKIGGPVVSWFKWSSGGFRELLEGCFLGPMPLWRKNLHDKYGGFDPGFTSAGDYEFWLRLAFNNEKFFKVNKIVGRYLKNDKSLERRDVNRNRFEVMEAKSRYFNNSGEGKGMVMIGMPTTRQLDIEYVMSLITTREFIWSPQKNQPADFSRNVIVQNFLSDPMKPEFLLFTDSDATWLGKQAVDRLIERDLPVVCGMFFKRDIPPVPTMGPSGGFDERGNQLYHFGKTIEAILARIKKSGLKEDEIHNTIVLPKDETDLFEIEGCGTHFVLIKREVLEKIKPPWFQYTTAGAGEDFYFCRKIREAGFSIHADLSVYTGHIAGDGLVFGLKQFLMFYNHTKEINAKEQIWAV